MIELDLESSRRGRIWLDKPLPAIFEVQDLQEEFIEAESIAGSEQHFAAIELQLMRGSRPVYGLLGATFSPYKSHNLIIQAGVGEGEVGDLMEFLVLKPEIIQLGLLPEYTQAILIKAVEEQQKTNPLFAGTLLFNCGVHGIFSSNSSVFGFLSETIIVVLGLLCRKAEKTKILEFVTSKLNKF